ncbi:Carboxylic ester hydrolase [Mycena indigotica]|uniref:Carboxylic ester hydrolase n=1 Tax=Mycena indigotica TaxID=2126181 RepID=A0A8H6S5I0_9AGAR|nr:Carboxylic ester hydrolase [Mycena indigotica]KAF7292605.1 Carboxylic ester hydrolase [Mycena indigotica]
MPALLSTAFLALLAHAHVVLGGIAARAAPSVTLDSGIFTGTTGSRNTQSFLGIPFAQPPVGDLRFRLPVANSPYTGTHSATVMGPGCPQQAVKLPLLTGLPGDVVDKVINSIFGIVFPSSEDCLTINVIKPATATSTSKLPVVAWIFGGGFELGSPQMYVLSSACFLYLLSNDSHICFDELPAFGFLASKEVRAAGVGNLGLQDQRQALRWVQKYIGAFGGDPTKVTIWGESAGAISVALQMVANNGDNEGLFRGGFMESGSPIPTGPLENGQKYYDQIVKQVGCSGAADTLACLRTVPFATLKAAQDATPFIFDYQSLLLAWLPREDGKFLTANPQTLVQQGKVSPVPFVNGDCDDEGTLFSFSTTNITTDAQFLSYIKQIWVPGATTAQLNSLNSLYPSDLPAGSPFDTGFADALTPQFKRIAAFQGDAVFQAPATIFPAIALRKAEPVGLFEQAREARALPRLVPREATS